MKLLESLLSFILPTLGLVVAWWCLHCRRLRRSRARIVDTLDDERGDMHAIITHTFHVEFPFLSRTSLEYALFRTYAIPSISRILARSGQFKLNPGKCYDDTDLLIQEFLLHHVDSERGSTAIRRLNYLHGLYPTIPNPDFLIVISLRKKMQTILATNSNEMNNARFTWKTLFSGKNHGNRIFH